MTAESLGWQLRSALPPMRLHSVSLCNTEGDVLWLSEGALGPDEHSVLIEAVGALSEDPTLPYHEYGMEDGRIAIFLAIRAPQGELVGLAMVIAELKSLSDGLVERMVTPQVRTILQRAAVLLKPAKPVAPVVPVLPVATPADTASPAPVRSAGKVEVQNAEPIEIDDISGVETILTLELIEDAPHITPDEDEEPAPAKASTKVVELDGLTLAPDAPVAKPAAARRPAGEDAGISTPFTLAPDDAPLMRAEGQAPGLTAERLKTPQEIDELLSIAIAPDGPNAPPTAKAPTVQPPTAAKAGKAAPAPEKAAPKVTPVEAVAAKPAAKGAAEPAPQKPPVKPAAVEPPGEKRPAKAVAEPVAHKAPPAKAGAPATRPAPAPKTAEEPISDETIEAESLVVEVEPPQAALDPASDLALYVQQLIKLRSNGRTRRFEVLARSRRNPSVNQVPDAFVGDSSRGREGSVLDGIVVQRLLAWLSENPSVWNSEPASFSINLSIGALEDEQFAQRVASWLSVSGVSPECIGFEITEFAAVQCKKHVQRFVEAIEKLGCFLVLDNFTMDSAAVPLLGSKAMRMVKMDSRLTQAAMKDKLSQAMVVAISQACKVLGLHCVAKRIESQPALQWLTAVGCDFAQGYLLEKPMPIDSIALRKSSS